MVVFVVTRYAVREAKKWRYAVRNAKIRRYAIRKAQGGDVTLITSVYNYIFNPLIQLKIEFMDTE